MKKRMVVVGVLLLTVATLALGGCLLFNHEPVASFNWSPVSPFAATNVSFDGSSSYDEDGTISTYSWDFGDGKTGNGVDPNHKYGDDGIYSVTLTVTDNDGAVGCTTHKVTIRNPAPIIGALTLKDIDTCSCCHNYVCDRIRAVLGNVVDPASVSSSPKSVVMTTIDWGDGTTSSGNSAIHQYSLPGLYTVTGKVIDDDGAVVAKTATILIEGLASPVVRLNPRPQTVDLGTTVNFRIEAYDPDGTSNCCGQCQPTPCLPPCHSCDVATTASFDEEVFRQLSMDASTSTSPQGISVDPNCGHCQGNGIVRMWVTIFKGEEDNLQMVATYDTAKGNLDLRHPFFSVCFDTPGRWKIVYMVKDDDCDCSRRAEGQKIIWVKIPDPCDPCMDPT